MVKFSSTERNTWLNRWAGRNTIRHTKRLQEAKITGGSKGMTLSQRNRKRPKYKEKVLTERKGILGSQQRGSASLRIMSQKKLREMFGVRQG